MKNGWYQSILNGYGHLFFFFIDDKPVYEINNGEDPSNPYNSYIYPNIFEWDPRISKEYSANNQNYTDYQRLFLAHEELDFKDGFCDVVLAVQKITIKMYNDCILKKVQKQNLKDFELLSEKEVAPLIEKQDSIYEIF